jgi:hypothetical protein
VTDTGSNTTAPPETAGPRGGGDTATYTGAVLDADAESPRDPEAGPEAESGPEPPGAAADPAARLLPAVHTRLAPLARPRRRRRKAVTWVAVVAVLAAAGSAAYIERGHYLHPAPSAAQAGDDNAAPVSTASATRRDLTSQTQVNGTLGYAGTYSVLAAAHGILTALPAIGQVITQGQAVYSVGADPVILLYGAVPAYRDLKQGDTGADVQQLNAALVALGEAGSAQIDTSSDQYTWQTAAAVEKLQAAIGVDQDGTLHLGQAVFLPTALRVSAVPATLGAPAGGPVLQGTSTTRRVAVQLDATLQAQVKVGDTVTVTLPDTSTTTGKVTAIGTVATAATGQGGAAGTPAVEVDVSLDDPAATGTLDQAPVQVSITSASARGALVVPVTSLLALDGGGYAVEVLGPGGARTLVAVTLGIFDDADGLVQVTDTALHPGDRVVVAGQ